jgi:[acyl-carrier-protein] S-malonyltransferase
MGEAWMEHPSWELVEEASDAARRDVGDLLLKTDSDELKLTHNAQLATFVMSLIVLDAVERVGVEPSIAAGHSLGEYTALTAVGALAYEDGVRLVAERGDAMRVAAEQHPGTMAAILGLEDERVAAACASIDDDVWPANFNARGQVVIAGSASGVAAASDKAKEMGAKRAMPLQVGGAFHTPFMAPARDRLREALAGVELRDPELPVIANVDAVIHSRGDEWKGLLASQLCSPVRWHQTLRALAGEGVATVVELGPGSALTGMAKRTLDGVQLVSVSSPDDIDGLLNALSTEKPVQALDQEGEHLFTTERLVVSPGAGVFVPGEGIAEGAVVGVGDALGLVGDQQARSPFAGTIMKVMAVEGERVAASQPIAWLRIG